MFYCMDDFFFKHAGQEKDLGVAYKMIFQVLQFPPYRLTKKFDDNFKTHFI